MSATMEKFTPTQQRILELLSDGLRHKRDEVLACLGDDMASLDTMQIHIVYLRKKLNPKGTDIVCQVYNGGYYYRHIRMLVNPNDGKR